MTYVIALPCVDLKDKACIEECPVDCIYEGERMLYIHPDECVDCGACEPVCPVEAIYYEDDVPEQWADYTAANVEFFDDLGSPGGAAKLGAQDRRPADRRPAAAGARPLAGERGPVRAPRQERRTSPGASRTLPDFPWDVARAVRRPRAAHPGRHRRPVGRHAGRPHARGRPRGARGGRRRPGLPARPRAPPRCARRARDWFARTLRGRRSTRTRSLPTIGSKELVAWLPPLLGLGPGDTVVIPGWPTRPTTSAPCSPGCEFVATDEPETGPTAPRWSGSTRRATPRARCSASSASPRSSPGPAQHGRRGRERRVLRRARLGRRAGVASSTRGVAAASHEGCSRVYSLSKQSNLAGYRAASSPATPRWSASCSRCASTPG